MRRKANKYVFILAGALAGVLSGCQKSPETSIVKHKDMDNMIEEAQNTENAVVNVNEVAEKYDTYQLDLSDEKLKVSVHVDAKVDIPKVDSLSVTRVAQTPIKQETIDKLIELTMSGEKMYDGSVLSVRTKGEIEREIAQITERKNNIAHDENYDVYVSECQMRIDMLEEEYLNSPNEIAWEDYISDGKLTDMANADLTNEFYKWAYDFNENGSLCYVVNSADETNRKSVYAQNNSQYGNCIRYRKGNVGERIISSPITGSTNLQLIDHIGGDSDYMMWKSTDNIPADLVYAYGEIKDMNTKPTTITRDEAIKQAEDFLKLLEINDFTLNSGDLYNECCLDLEGVGYKTYYILQYTRKKDGVPVTFDNSGKHEEGWVGDNYVKKSWNIESIEFRINDEGIIGFSYNAPLEMRETVVEKTALKSFDDVKSTFEQMILVSNATSEESIRKEIEIDRVVLGYCRVSEADSYDTGLLIPVWDFIGKTSTYYVDESFATYNYGSILTINAIDGTIVDRSLGY